MVETIDIEMNPGAQTDFITSEDTFPAFMGGYRSGKTAAAVIKAVNYSLEYPGAVGVWTEPVAALFSEALLPTLRKFFGKHEGQMWQETGRGGPNHQIQFFNGSYWMLKAAETPERLVGFECAWALMDEAASTEHGSQEEAYLKLVGRLSQQGYPHWLGITSTPAGYNWIWREWVESPTPGHILWQGSSLENPKLEESYKEQIKRTYVEGTPMYDQYVLGKFVAMEGMVLPGFDANIHACIRWPEEELFTRKVAGVDFAPHSPTTVIEVATTATNHLWLREWLYKWECDDETFIKACRDAREAGVTLFACDPSGKERISWMIRQGLSAVAAPSNLIDRRVKAWRTPLGEGRLSVDRDSPFLIRELTGLLWAKRRGRELETNEFSQDSPDHAFDGGAYGLQQIERTIPTGFPVPKLVVRL